MSNQINWYNVLSKWNQQSQMQNVGCACVCVEKSWCKINNFTAETPSWCVFVVYTFSIYIPHAPDYIQFIFLIFRERHQFREAHSECQSSHEHMCQYKEHSLNEIHYYVDVMKILFKMCENPQNKKRFAFHFSLTTRKIWNNVRVVVERSLPQPPSLPHWKPGS